MANRFEKTNKVFSRFGGLPLLERLVSASEIDKQLSRLVPTDGFVGVNTPAEKFLGLIYGFACDANCLDDLEVLSQDEGFLSVSGPMISSHLYSEFLAEFDLQQLRELQTLLIRTSMNMRKMSHGLNEFTLTLDSTQHEQFGLKQEGLNFSYTKELCLDSLHAYDTHGYPYWYSVRPGETHTSKGAQEVLSAVFKELPKSCKNRLVLADSGDYSKDFFNACALQNARFVVAMRSNVYGPILGRSLHWKRAPGDMKFFDGRDFEYAETVYHPADCDRTLRIVLVRSLRANHSNGLLFAGADYDYAAFATDIGMHEQSAKDILLAYRKRSNTENFIREMKNGIDTRRFQCRRLVANNALAMAAAFANAFLRFLAHIQNKK
jgi:Transposase DDE domain group 1